MRAVAAFILVAVMACTAFACGVKFGIDEKNELRNLKQTRRTMT